MEPIGIKEQVAQIQALALNIRDKALEVNVILFGISKSPTMDGTFSEPAPDSIKSFLIDITSTLHIVNVTLQDTLGNLDFSLSTPKSSDVGDGFTLTEERKYPSSIYAKGVRSS